MSDIFSCDRRIIDLNSRDMFSIETFTTLHNIAKDRIDEKNHIIYDMPLIELDHISRNRSLYEADGYWNAVQSPYIQEKLRRGTLFGEKGHPDPSCTRERFMRIDLDNVAHKNINVKRKGNTVYGDVQYVRPKGPDVWDWIMSGSNMAQSTRVLTPNYDERKDTNGMPYIHKFGQMRLVGWDTVDIPGIETANIVPLESYDASKENWGGIHLNWSLARKKDEFINLLKSQESCPIMEDLYGFSMSDVKNLSYSEEGLITISLVDGADYKRSIKIPTNTFKVNQVLCAGN